ncbi:MAG: histidine phosphatase family protein [Oligoflexia bacterium]|nr:histidine phosphatase family protein [Oligoflexia bacterium]
MTQTFVFIRHAHRDTSERELDNGIDEKGRVQVEELIKKYKLNELPKADEFWSSPKLRCQETLEPLAKIEKAKLKIVEELDEQTNKESSKEFRKRIFNFLQKLKKAEKVIYLCSHGDWLPEALQELTGMWVDVKKAQAIVCIYDEKGWHLR